MLELNILLWLLMLAWFVPAFFFTHKHFKEHPKDKRVGFRKNLMFWLNQLSFILWPIILVIVALSKLISKVAKKKGKSE